MTILTGKDAGKTGTVSQVFPRLQKVVVDGVNMMKKHIRTHRKGEKGQIVEFFGPVHISNITLTKEEKVTAKKTDKKVATTPDSNTK